MRHLALFGLLIGHVALVACGVCDDCFDVQVRSSEAAWEPCCTYTRANVDDPVFVRFERLDGAAYRAGVEVGCRWNEATVTLVPTRIARGTEELPVDRGVNLDFGTDDPVVELTVACDAARPPPEYPEVVLRLLDDDLAAQFAPGEDDPLLVIRRAE